MYADRPARPFLRVRFPRVDRYTTTALRRGDPAEEILAYADDIGVDLVVMGTRGEEFTENMLGSTAQTVVVRCPC
ncbi:hypothetical protein BRC92_12965 [Halobacteriales archaeon QS_4_69_31]|nr:MAG: hypothetical protein BRC92_12965 [Halobacteriales archaeon QS_4_69_31]